MSPDVAEYQTSMIPFPTYMRVLLDLRYTVHLNRVADLRPHQWAELEYWCLSMSGDNVINTVLPDVEKQGLLPIAQSLARNCAACFAQQRAEATPDFSQIPGGLYPVRDLTVPDRTGLRGFQIFYRVLHTHRNGAKVFFTMFRMADGKICFSTCNGSEYSG